MFSKLRRARADVATMHALLPSAETIARRDGVHAPGAEHLLLAALDLEDGRARAVLAEFGVGTAELVHAIAAHHDDALRTVGVTADDEAVAAALPPVDAPRGLLRSQGSLQVAFRRAVDAAKADGVPLDSAHVLLAVAAPAHGTVPAVLDRLGVDRDALRTRLVSSA